MPCKSDSIESPHADLVPFLEKHGISWEAFKKVGRCAPRVKRIRELIVTEMHESGYSWSRMIEVTGKSLGFVQRNTKAVGCPAAKENKRENARKSGRLGKGKKKPAMSERLRREWAEGKFDFFKQPLPEKEVQRLRDYWSSQENRDRASIRMKNWWQKPEYRERLMRFHLDPVERERRSKVIGEHMMAFPFQSRGTLIPVSFKGRSVTLRSKLEKRFFDTYLEDIADVAPCIHYEGRYFYPDFILQTKEGKTVVEVKSDWVLQHDSEQAAKSRDRLDRAKRWAIENGMGFRIWTESGYV